MGPWTDYDACEPHHSWVYIDPNFAYGGSASVAWFLIAVPDRTPFEPIKSYHIKITIENPLFAANSLSIVASIEF